MIHPTSLIDPGVEIDDDVVIGPYCVITGRVVIGRGCRLVSHVCLNGPLTLGSDNILYPFTCLGHDPQDRKYDGATAGITMGSRNTLRESVTVHASTRHDRPTTIGDDNLLMTNSHVGHDAMVGSRCTIVTGAGIGGHAILDDESSLGGHSAMHQFCRLGRLSFLGAQSLITKDVPPFALASGINSIMGVNAVGLRRRGVTHQAVDAVKSAFRTLYLSGHTVPIAATMIEESASHPTPGAELCRELVSFIRLSQRGLVPHAATSARHRLQR